MYRELVVILGLVASVITIAEMLLRDGTPITNVQPLTRALPTPAAPPIRVARRGTSVDVAVEAVPRSLGVALQRRINALPGVEWVPAAISASQVRIVLSADTRSDSESGLSWYDTSCSAYVAIHGEKNQAERISAQAAQEWQRDAAIRTCVLKLGAPVANYLTQALRKR